MFRRKFIKGLSLAGLTGLFAPVSNGKEIPKVIDERKLWVDYLLKISTPVLEALSKDKLQELMPVEAASDQLEKRKKVTYLEAFGRTLAGLSPWLELGPDETHEGIVRKKYIELSLAALENAVTPGRKDYMNFTTGGQPLVDAAFLAHALLRAPVQLWGNLSAKSKSNLIEALKSTREIKPPYNNWLLFSAMVEAALLKFSDKHDAMRVDYAVKQHFLWYKGDGAYGDGADFHFDYYNSFVIQPMLLDVLKTVNEKTGQMKEELETARKRARRFAEVQERMISPEGTFPVFGRSLAYRCGAFQLLAQMALTKDLPESLSPAQVRSALTAVMKRSLEASRTFDEKGWLKIGFCGHQPGIGELYISTGSLYLASLAFLPLGLPPKDTFWSSPPSDWTSKKAYEGKDFPIDHALH